MTRPQLLRLGLFQMAAGGLSVLFLGVLNRVMRFELGLDLLVVGLLVGGGHYLGAVVAIPFGHFSDMHRIGGYRRTLYILLGVSLTGLILALSPWVVRWLAPTATPLHIAAAFIFFLLEGMATFVAGTAYLALIADRTSRVERGPATGIVWTLMMVGIIVTGVGAAMFMRIYAFERMVTLFTGGFAVTLLLAVVALWRQEPRSRDELYSRHESLRVALTLLARSQNSRRFAVFLMVGMFSYFMQDVILEPFGGEVFGLPPAETTRFNSYMGVGVVAGMLLGGLSLIPWMGKRWVAGLGCWIMVTAFGGLAAVGFSESARILAAAITLLGLGAGFFTVGSVSLMMDMTSSQHTGLFMGAWTLVQALAKGPASLLSGGL
ncbi:MAG TPA: BCD family MFS transporter [Anaerolineales bacterium]|jgi:BCD family chlorophyll transporter-like MFS transporter|nr:BCD family MFS transporter [Anaerolineales bacterium]HJO33938.1 BCD family MFS transporter [Anaerolineales bacterium]|tara:strand:- start:359 stop:1489 length:1131 start_codon:yes stop_codon:yes gene_type:complete